MRGFPTDRLPQLLNFVFRCLSGLLKVISFPFALASLEIEQVLKALCTAFDVDSSDSWAFMLNGPRSALSPDATPCTSLF